MDGYSLMTLSAEIHSVEFFCMYLKNKLLFFFFFNGVMQIKWFRYTGTKAAVEIALMLNSMRRQHGKQSW